MFQILPELILIEVRRLRGYNRTSGCAEIIYRVIRLPLRYYLFPHPFRIILDLISDMKIRSRDLDLKYIQDNFFLNYSIPDLMKSGRSYEKKRFFSFNNIISCLIRMRSELEIRCRLGKKFFVYSILLELYFFFLF